MRIYSYQLEKHILPAFGELPVRDIGVAHIEACLSKLTQKGHATSTLRSVRATFATVLRSAVKRGYLGHPEHDLVRCVLHYVNRTQFQLAVGSGGL